MKANKLDIADTLKAASQEIRILRETANDQREKLEIFYGMMRMTTLHEPKRQTGMSEDIAWKSEKLAIRLLDEAKNEAGAVAPAPARDEGHQPRI